MKKIILFLMCFALTLTPNLIKSQDTIKGVVMPGTLMYDSTALILNGAGIRTKFFIEIYIAGLYLKQKSTKDKAIIDADETMAVRLHVISNTVTKDRMSEAIREGFDRSLMGKTEKYRSQIDMTVEIFKSDPVHVGDIYDFWYIPNKGVIAFKNGVDLHVLIPGIGFKKAMFGIWLCPNPVEEKLKVKMLGL